MGVFQQLFSWDYLLHHNTQHPPTNTLHRKIYHIHFSTTLQQLFQTVHHNVHVRLDKLSNVKFVHNVDG